MNKLFFPYDQTLLEIQLPEAIRVRLLTPHQTEPAPNPVGEIKRALRNPSDAEPLASLASRKKSAVVLVSDQTRLAPSSLFLQYVIEEIVRGGIKKKDMAVVVAAGAHRKVTPGEIKTLVGTEIYRELKCLCSSPALEECEYLGKTSRGTPVHIFQEVAKYELKVATGNIEPHRMASFSGGAKAMVPGCSSLESIEKNHALSQHGHTGKDPGQNEVRADAEEAAALAGLDFVFNVVVDPFGCIVKAFAGHPVRAQREGCLLARQIYRVESGPPGDMVLASAGGHPKDQNLYQAIKALQNAAAVVKLGGTVVLAARCLEGLGNETFRRWVESGCTGAKALERISGRFELGGHKVAYAAQITEKCKVCLVSDLPGEVVRRLHFEPFRTLQEACAAAMSGLKKEEPEVVVMPYAGLTFPSENEVPG